MRLGIGRGRVVGQEAGQTDCTPDRRPEPAPSLAGKTEWSSDSQRNRIQSTNITSFNPSTAWTYCGQLPPARPARLPTPGTSEPARSRARWVGGPTARDRAAVPARRSLAGRRRTNPLGQRAAWAANSGLFSTNSCCSGVVVCSRLGLWPVGVGKSYRSSRLSCSSRPILP